MDPEPLEEMFAGTNIGAGMGIMDSKVVTKEYELGKGKRFELAGQFSDK
jgi:hypothetical protein